MKKFIYLKYIKDLRDRIDSDNGLIQVLIGPRQVGKTTSVLCLIDDYYVQNAHYVSADKVFNSDSSWLLEQWTKAQKENKYPAHRFLSFNFNFSPYFFLRSHTILFSWDLFKVRYFPAEANEGFVHTDIGIRYLLPKKLPTLFKVFKLI